ncbi:MAG TPA: transketolase [Polyangia bacterium]|nr:transketolase [Polyangia bacterium]
MAVNTIKFLSIDAIEKANSGHPGLPMGAADYAFILWSRYLKFDAKDPHWPDRDRFVLSAGHGSMLLYSLMHLSGFEDMPLEQLKQVRQWGSKTPGHPESHITKGVEVTTGPLGQGFANGVGMAVAAKMANERFPGLFNHRIWGIVSDGDMMEGISHEAASIAGHLKLGNLTYLYDDNKITLDGKLDESMDEDVGKRFEAYGWRILHIDGHDHAQIESAFDAAVAETERPFLILCRTHIGNGSPNKHDSNKAHGEPLGEKETKLTKEAAGWPLDKPFWVPDEVHALWKKRGEELAAEHARWNAHKDTWLNTHPDLATLYATMSEKRVPADLLAQLDAAAPKQTDATRSLAGAVLQTAAKLIPSLIGGDADLGGSTKTPIKDSTKVEAGTYGGRNLRFGIREHAMGAMANGITAYGLFIPFTATFLTFSDYMRPAIRLAALSRFQVIHVFTHDSVFLGEDGPTHQSIEHTSALRLIPHLHVWRPADAIECAAAWAHALERKDGPSELILSRQKVAEPPAGTKATDAYKGGYIMLKEDGGAPDVTFLATGSEVGVAVEAARELAKGGVKTRVVSLPCLEVFNEQDAAWKKSVLGDGGVRVSIEAGRTDLWKSWVGATGLTIGIDDFGYSAPANVIAEKLGLTGPLVAARVKKFLGK